VIAANRPAIAAPRVVIGTEDLLVPGWRRRHLVLACPEPPTTPVYGQRGLAAACRAYPPLCSGNAEREDFAPSRSINDLATVSPSGRAPALALAAISSELFSAPAPACPHALAGALSGVDRAFARADPPANRPARRDAGLAVAESVRSTTMATGRLAALSRRSSGINAHDFTHRTWSFGRAC
jgi:hypothetical protein